MCFCLQTMYYYANMKPVEPNLEISVKSEITKTEITFGELISLLNS